MLFFLMNIKFDIYFYFSAFDPEVKATEILQYIQPFSWEKRGQNLADLKIDCLFTLGWQVKRNTAAFDIVWIGRGRNYQVFGKY